jgi:hypothetical protein
MNTNFLSTAIATEILKKCEAVAVMDISSNYAVVKSKTDTFGIINTESFDAIHNSTKRFHIHDEDKRRTLYHEDNKKMVKKISKEKTLPEGAVIFPEENFIIMNANGDTPKQRDNFLRRLIPNSKHLEVGDGAIFVSNNKKEDEYFIAPYVEISNPDVLLWACVPNERKAGYAWIGMTFEQAVEKMLTL